ncbi:hypothetical protein E2C01_043045 [Portunus trituberculatus]|uniref:Uncharacterized protein n=1 Tax=Portunus trituberculatus TaxID=210409 RepID=A0A5B7FWF4_PORTR|nr:hypothetical protein [Portunus trituberculatus]
MHYDIFVFLKLYLLPTPSPPLASSKHVVIPNDLGSRCRRPTQTTPRLHTSPFTASQAVRGSMTRSHHHHHHHHHYHRLNHTSLPTTAPPPLTTRGAE